MLIAGFGKAGKSSLFNAIYGENVAKVSMHTDETDKAQTQERFGIDFTDMPGIGIGKSCVNQKFFLDGCCIRNQC